MLHSIANLFSNTPRRAKWTAIWLGAIAFFAGCQSSNPVAYAPDQLVPTEKSLLWKISGNGLKHPSYLFGTIHIIPKEDFALSTQTLAAIEASKRVAFEIDMKDMTNLRTQLGLFTKAFMGGGKTLRDLLSVEDYALVRTKMDEKGLPLTMLERLKPMFLSTMFGTDEQVTGADKGAMTSVEMEIYKLSKSAGKASAGLETADYQLALFDSIPYDAQAKMLVDNLRSTNAGDDEFGKMIALYKSQDVAGMAETVVSEASGMKKFEYLLLEKRNRNWLVPMRRMMLDKSTFFAVGAGHLGGQNGVVALLREQGYRVAAASN